MKNLSFELTLVYSPSRLRILHILLLQLTSSWVHKIKSDQKTFWDIGHNYCRSNEQTRANKRTFSGGERKSCHGRCLFSCKHTNHSRSERQSNPCKGKVTSDNLDEVQSQTPCLSNNMSRMLGNVKEIKRKDHFLSVVGIWVLRPNNDKFHRNCVWQSTGSLSTCKAVSICLSIRKRGNNSSGFKVFRVCWRSQEE